MADACRSSASSSVARPSVANAGCSETSATRRVCQRFSPRFQPSRTTPLSLVAADHGSARSEYPATDSVGARLTVHAASDASLVVPLQTQSALLSTSCGVLYDPSHTVLSFISDEELVERHVLSAWVLGEDRSRLVPILQPEMFGERRERWSQIRSTYERVIHDTPVSALDKFRVRYALTPCVSPPTAATGNWRLLGRNPMWCAWERGRPLPN